MSAWAGVDPETMRNLGKSLTECSGAAARRTLCRPCVDVEGAGAGVVERWAYNVLESGQSVTRAANSRLQRRWHCALGLWSCHSSY